MHGIQTWDAAGVVNNKGLKPFLFSQLVRLSVNQTGSWSINLVSGTKAGFIFIPDVDNSVESNQFTRIISASDGVVTVSNGASSPSNRWKSGAGSLYIFLVNV